MNEVKKKPILLKVIQKLVSIFYRKYEVEFRCEQPKQGQIYVSNHSQIHGPIAMYLYFFRQRFIWVIGQMFKRKDAVDYMMDDFWRNKSKFKQFFYKIFSVIIAAPLASFIMKSADTIPVYKDIRLRKTLNDTISCLKAKHDVIIFPEYREPYNKFVNQFQINFIDVARVYYRRTNERLYFYPVYTCADLKKIIIGEPIQYDPTNDFDSEKSKIVTYLMDEVSKIAESLPNHIIVPYNNINKKNFIYSKK